MRIEGPFIPSGSVPQSDSYTTKAGDTLQSIGKQFGVLAQQLADANKLDVKMPLKEGIQLLIPKGSHPVPHQAGIAGHKDQFESHKTGVLDSMLSSTGQPISANQQPPTNIGSVGEISPLPVSSLGEIMIKPGIQFELAPKPPTTFEGAPAGLAGEILSPKPPTTFEGAPAGPAITGELLESKPLPADLENIDPKKE